MSRYLKAIGAILQKGDCQNLTECADGTYSTAKGRGACAGHGGIKGAKKRAIGATTAEKKLNAEFSGFVEIKKKAALLSAYGLKADKKDKVFIAFVASKSARGFLKFLAIVGQEDFNIYSLSGYQYGKLTYSGGQFSNTEIYNRYKAIFKDFGSSLINRTGKMILSKIGLKAFRKVGHPRLIAPIQFLLLFSPNVADIDPKSKAQLYKILKSEDVNLEGLKSKYSQLLKLSKLRLTEAQKNELYNIKAIKIQIGLSGDALAVSKSDVFKLPKDGGAIATNDKFSTFVEIIPPNTKRTKSDAFKKDFGQSFTLLNDASELLKAYKINAGKRDKILLAFILKDKTVPARKGKTFRIKTFMPFVAVLQPNDSFIIHPLDTNKIPKLRFDRSYDDPKTYSVYQQIFKGAQNIFANRIAKKTVESKGLKVYRYIGPTGWILPLEFALNFGKDVLNISTTDTQKILEAENLKPATSQYLSTTWALDDLAKLAPTEDQIKILESGSIGNPPIFTINNDSNIFIQKGTFYLRLSPDGKTKKIANADISSQIGPKYKVVSNPFYKEAISGLSNNTWAIALGAALVGAVGFTLLKK